MLGFVCAVLWGSRSTLGVLGGGCVGGWFALFGSQAVQVGYSLHQFGLGLLQQSIDVLGAVLGQTGPLLLPVTFCRLRSTEMGTLKKYNHWW